MGTALAFQMHKQAIDDELKERITKFKAHVRRRSTMLDALAEKTEFSPLTLVAQGDSWFDYPLPILTHSDVIAHLNAMPLSPNILSLAHHGEAAEGMLGVEKYERLRSVLLDGENDQQFDAILFSGGGNDLAGDQFRLWLRDAAKVANNPDMGLNPEMVTAIMEIVVGSYQSLIELRDLTQTAYGNGREIPIFAHSYDYAIPTGKGVCSAGPWLLPGLQERGWNEANGQVIVKHLLAGFAAALDTLETSTPNFIHVRTQGTLSEDQWANELHPTPEGFAAISVKFVEALRIPFPGRI
ncbi:MAG: hypothetical protein NVS3B3_04010 [Aquirhabdus sp.]